MRKPDNLGGRETQNIRHLQPLLKYQRGRLASFYPLKRVLQVKVRLRFHQTLTV
ncbi:MAG: hypothetical protein KAW17_09785 [Candidatus Eisenbacteria sp.]|nr:hypothetical protein [Candidatus Eisenbacteria bacterium]